MKLVHAWAERRYDSRALMGRIGHRAVSAGLACAVVFAAGCGSSGPRQDANEPSGSYKVEVVSAKFPAKQSLAQRSRLVITVKNVDTRTIPDIAVTVKDFDKRLSDPGLADPRRPTFVVNTGPRGGDTAYVGTSALGPLRPGQTKSFVWDVTAVVAGPYRLNYEVAAGLNGKAKAVLASGGLPSGSFSGKISSKAPQAKVADDGHTIIKGSG